MSAIRESERIGCGRRKFNRDPSGNVSIAFAIRMSDAEYSNRILCRADESVRCIKGLR